MRRPPLWSLLALFVVSRLLILCFMKPAEIYNYGGEELYQGLIAKLLLDRLGFPILLYSPNSYRTGALAVGALGAVFFRLLGPTALALKLVPIAIFTAALAAWQWLVDSYFGRRAAILFSLLFIFSPPDFTVHTFSAMGFHPETILFSGLALRLYLDLALRSRREAWRAAALGLACGLGTWLSLQFLIVPAAILLHWAWLRRGLPDARLCGAAAAGFAAGCAPLIAAAASGVAIFRITDSPVWSMFNASGFTNDFIGWSFASSFGSRTWPSRWKLPADLAYSVVFVALLGGGLLVARRRSQLGKPTPAALLLLYLIVFAAVGQAYTAKADRYCLPAFPAVFVFSTLALEEAGRFAMPALGGLLLLWGGFHSLLLAPRRAGEALRTKSYAYGIMPYLLCQELEPCSRYLQALRPVTRGAERFAATFSFAQTAEALLMSEHAIGPAIGKARVLGAALGSDAGRLLFYALGQDLGRGSPAAIRRIAPLLNERERQFFAWGSLETSALPAEPPTAAYGLILAAGKVFPPETREDYWRATGEAFARRRWETDPSVANLGTLAAAEGERGRWPPRRREAFAQGVGAWLYRAWQSGEEWPILDQTGGAWSRPEATDLSRLPAPMRRAAVLGSGIESALRNPFSLEDPATDDRLKAAFLRGLPADEAAAFDAGRRWTFERFGLASY